MAALLRLFALAHMAKVLINFIKFPTAASQGEELLLSIIIISSLGPGGSCGIIYIVMGRDKRSSRRMCAEGVKWLYGW